MQEPLTEREEQILLLLKNFDYMTRDQIRYYFGLKSVRNTNRVLKGLEHFVSSIRDGYQSIYYLNSIGREYVGCDKVRKKTGLVQHTIMRNEFYQYAQCPSDWENEIKVSDGEATVIVDAMYTKVGVMHFLEVDHLQFMKENRAKIERYKALYETGALEQQLGHFPTLVWLTTTELRRIQLKEACEGLPVAQVYLYNEIQ